MSFESGPKRKPDDAGRAAQKPAEEPRESRFASLTASLLARKGEAEPALEPFAQARAAPGAAREMAPGARHAVDKLVAGEARPARVEPIDDASDVREEWLRVRPAEPEPAAPGKPEDAPRMTPGGDAKHDGAKDDGQKDGDAFAENCPRRKIATSPKRAAVTFRMSVHDFLRLKLGAAVLERSSQDIIIDALEVWLDGQGVERLDNCRCLAEAARACEDREAAE